MFQLFRASYSSSTVQLIETEGNTEETSTTVVIKAAVLGGGDKIDQIDLIKWCSLLRRKISEANISTIEVSVPKGEDPERMRKTMECCFFTYTY